MTPPPLVVLVVGPPLAGVTAVVQAVGGRLPGAVVVEAAGLAPDRAPDAVLAVLSAAAPLTRSDWVPIARVAAATALVVAAVTKVDAHRAWRDVVAADRKLVAAWDPRHESIPWLGVAAAPGIGEACVDELVELLGDGLADLRLHDRNGLRVSRSGPVRLARGAESRRVLQATRLHLLRFVRDESTTMRAELRDAAATVGIGGSAAFETVVTAASVDFHVRLTEEIVGAVDAAAADLGLATTPGGSGHGPPHVSRTPSSSRRLEGRLMTVLGVGFGLGIALASSRVLAGLAPGLSVPGMAAGAVAGAALVVWVVRTRGLLHDRALLDRWVVEVGATLRWHGEALVAERLLAVETQWLAAAPRKAAGTASDPSPHPTGVKRRHVTDQYEWC